LQRASAQPAVEAPKSGDDRKEKVFSFTEQMGLVSVINLVLLIVVPLVLKLQANATWCDLGIERAGLARNVKIGVVAFFLTTPAVFSTNAIAQLVFRTNKHPLELMLRQEASLAGVIVALVSAIILAPAAEELIFRAVFQGWLIRATFRREGLGEELEVELGTHSSPTSPDGPQPDDGLEGSPTSACPEGASPTIPAAPPISRLPVMLTSLLFAAVHAPQMPAPIPIFLLSLVLGTLYQRTGSLIPSFVVHAMFNGFSTVILLIDMIGKSSR
jgi:membrane protease YdiL (CAAX protease family)